MRLERVAFASAAATVALQVVLPRIFSVVLWYHLAFFAVSLAMLGGALGAWIVRRRAQLGRDPVDDSAALAAGAAATVVAVALAVRLPIDPTRLFESAGEKLLLLLLAAALAAPFAAFGAALTAALAEAAGRGGPRGRGESAGTRTWSAGFLGGAAGAWIALAAMDRIGAPRAVGAIALLALAGCRPRGLLSHGSFAAVLAIAALAMPASILPMPSRKHFPKIPEADVLDERWNAFSRVTFFRNPLRYGLWHTAPGFDGPLPESIGVAIDAWAITSILRLDPGADRSFFAHYPPTIGYVGAAPGFSCLVIGAGGGVDVHAALAAGAGRVVAVEINPLIVGAVKEQFRGFAGDLYRQPKVEAVVAEGRAYLESSDARFDRIVMTGVDTFAATEAGAFALSENFLYTVEALRTAWDRLADGGVLCLTRWWFEPPRQTLRLALTATEALAGEAAARDCVFIARADLNSLFLMRKGGFAPAEVDALLAAAEVRGAEVVYAPGRGGREEFASALDPQRAAAVVDDSDYRVEPTTDDRPFFFESTRLSRLLKTEGDWIHDRLGGAELLVATLVVLLLLALPLIVSSVRGAGALPGRTALACLLLGAGYLAVEAPLLTRLSLVLGHPVYAVSVVLAGLLIGSAIGARISERLLPERAGDAALVAALMVGAILVIGQQELLDAVRGESTPARVLAVLLFLALPALAMGMPFPLALRRLEGGAAIGAACSVNAVGSVIAVPLATLLALEMGFRATLVAGAAAYLLAAILLGIGFRSRLLPT